MNTRPTPLLLLARWIVLLMSISYCSLLVAPHVHASNYASKLHSPLRKQVMPIPASDTPKPPPKKARKTTSGVSTGGGGGTELGVIPICKSGLSYFRLSTRKPSDSNFENLDNWIKMSSFRSTTERFGTVSFETTGWLEDEEVTVTITKPNGHSVTSVYRATSDGSSSPYLPYASGPFFVTAKYTNTFDDRVGEYRFRFSGKSGVLDITERFIEISSPRFYILPDGRLFGTGYKRGERIELYEMRYGDCAGTGNGTDNPGFETCAWNGFRADQKGQFLITPFYTHTLSSDLATDVYVDLYDSKTSYLIAGEISGVSQPYNSYFFAVSGYVDEYLSAMKEVLAASSLIDTTPTVNVTPDTISLYARPLAPQPSRVFQNLAGPMQILDMVIEEAEPWWKVKLSNGAVGWIPLDLYLNNTELPGYLQKGNPKSKYRLRVRPDLRSKSIRFINGRERILLTGSRIAQERFWWHVMLADGTQGWIANDGTMGQHTFGGSSSDQKYSHYLSYANKSGLPVWNEPDVCSPVSARVGAGHTLQIVPQNEFGTRDWIQVTLQDGRTGWVPLGFEGSLMIPFP